MFHSSYFALGAIEKYSSVKNKYKRAEFETIKIMPANPYPTRSQNSFEFESCYQFTANSHSIQDHY